MKNDNGDNIIYFLVGAIIVVAVWFVCFYKGEEENVGQQR